MDRRRKAKWTGRAQILGMALLLGFMGACAFGSVDPGPTPVRITLNLNAALPPALVKKTLEENGLSKGYVPLPGGNHQVRGPLWEWGVYQIQKDGSLERLRPTGDSEVELAEGNKLSAVATFLSPPGKQGLAVVADAYLEHTWREGFGRWFTQSITVRTFRRDFEYDFAPGENLHLKQKFRP